MKHQLSGIIGDRHRQIIHAIVDEIVSDPGEEYALKLMPTKLSPTSTLIHEKVSGHGGMTGERNFGEKGKAINAGSSKMRAFFPGSYQEHVKFTEKDLLMLRKLGSLGERGVTGLTSGELDHLSRSGQKLQLRIRNRISKLIWDSIFNGTFVWKNQTFSFDIPGANPISATTDWSDAAAGKPMQDLWAIQTTNAKMLKYNLKEWVINPKTAADIMKTAEVREVLKNYNMKENDINAVAQFLCPGLAPIKVVKDHYQDESLVDGEIVMGNAQFFVPDDKVLPVPDFSKSMYGSFGEFELTENLNDPSATLDRPAVGAYTFIDEKGLEELEAPYVKAVGGFNGGPNLIRSDDVFIVSV